MRILSIKTLNGKKNLYNILYEAYNHQTTIKITYQNFFIKLDVLSIKTVIEGKES